MTRLLRNHRPLSAGQLELAQHVRRCQQERRDRRALARRARELRAWRMAYPHRWPIAFNRLPAAWQSWAYQTGACESGNNPATNTGNGFHGAFQFLLSTWAMAGGSGYPEQHSWHYQAVIAVHWRQRSSQSQWPNCAPW